jgi:uncharacterized protein
VSQSLSIREQLKVLEQVQELDLKLDKLKSSRDAVPAALKSLDDNLGKLRAGGAAKAKALEELEKTERQTQAALDLNRDRLTRSSSRLEGVQNSQEFAAINKEIEQLKKMNGSLTEQSKKAQADIEALRKEVAEFNTQLSTGQTERADREAKLTGQSGQLNAEISTLASERQKATQGLDPRLLAQYDRVRGARGGLGLVPAIAGRCKGCNMVVPPQLYNEIQRGSHLHGCPSCHRLLFVPVQPEAKSGG